jgi:hypothetical protein
VVLGNQMSHPSRLIAKSSAAVAVFTAVVYVWLSCLAAGCLIMHAVSSDNHDHHASDDAHSPLCSWSCQATSGVALVSTPPAFATYTVERTEPSGSFVLTASQILARLHPRGPPPFSFA